MPRPRLNGNAGGGPDTGTRTQGREFAVHPDEIKQLHTGWAVVACPGRTQPTITRMLHPEDAR